MPRLEWDKIGERFYETGISKGVLFVYDNENKTYKSGVAWNGLTAVTESPTGAEENPHYADDIKYLSIRSVEELGGTIEAYTYPDEWEQCDGSVTLEAGVTIGQQSRTMFALCYRTVVGNDVDYENHAYKLHILYGCTASPSEKAFATINDSPEAITFSWELTTVPVPVEGYKPTSLLTVNSSKVKPEDMIAIENALYGTESDDSKLLMPNELLALITPEEPVTP